MIVIVGILIVILSVVGGFLEAGGSLLVLVQLSEIIIIVGATIGSLLIASTPTIIKKMISGVGGLMKGNPFTKAQYLALLKTMFEIFNIATREGLINIEAHIETPEKSAIFTKNQFLLHRKSVLEFFTDTLKLLLGGGVPPHDLESLLDADIETRHELDAIPAALLQKAGDALPGLGIVAAVLGIIITMQSIGGAAEEVGKHVAAALVGTFLGVLLAYGFVNPLATNLENAGRAEMRYFECVKAGVIAFAKGTSPTLTVEFARRVIYEDVRPTFDEVEQAIRSIKQGKG
jgi:chemotaxis protein MotA